MGLDMRARLRAGDPDAFGWLFTEYARAVYNHALRTTPRSRRLSGYRWGRSVLGCLARAANSSDFSGNPPAVADR
jgi:hypothetical protein